MAEKSDVPSKVSNGDITPGIIDRWIKHQGEQIQVELSNVKIREKEADNAHDYNKMLLKAQVEDLKGVRKHEIHSAFIVLGFILIIGLLAMAFIVYLLYTEEKQFAWEIIKIGGAVIISVTGGFFAGRQFEKQQSSKESPTQ